MKILNGTGSVLPFVVGTGGLTKNGLCVLTTGKAVKAAAAPTAATVLGLACDDYDADEIGYVEIIEHGAEVQAPFITSGTKKTFADTDLGKVYDLSDETKIAPDDTTGGCCHLVGYDNDILEARFVIPSSFLYV